MPAIEHVIVAGATGSLGPQIVGTLISSGFKVSILTRNADKTIPNAKSIVTDYSTPSLINALQGQDALVSTVGAAGIMEQIKLIDAANTVGIKRFIPSDFAPYTPDLTAMESVVPQLYARLKPRQVVLDYLKEQTSKHPGFTWTAIGSCPLFDWSLKTGAQGLSIPTRSAVITDSGNEPYVTTTIPQIARAISQCLSHPKETENKYLLIKSFTTTQDEILALLEKATKSTWNVKHVTSNERKEQGLEMLNKGIFAGLGYLWNVWLNTDGKGIIPPQDAFGNELLNLPQEDMAQVVMDLITSTPLAKA